ncbi:MAG: prolipoprotein diacylglyceryl transferase family protein [Nitrospiraceae bacterium]
MVNELCLAIVASGYGVLFWWAFRTLPHKGWQILAAIPAQERADGTWTGLNLTYYGLFTANGVTIAVMFVIVLLGSLSISLRGTVIFVALLLGLCIPSAKFIAKAVEAKAYTFTIGGASFVGLIAAPWLIMATNSSIGAVWGFRLPILETLSVLGIAYAMGEGTGRLACISFGCCYGKPVTSSYPWMNTIFRTYHFAFEGPTKKIAYEGCLESVPVIPIQAITAVLYVTAGLLGLAFFLYGYVFAAFIATALVTHLWRVVSEFFRADHRGEGDLSVYQILALLGAFYALIVALSFQSTSSAAPDLLLGLQNLRHPETIVALQAIWLTIFLYTGRSHVTTSTLSFSVLKSRI